jgi:hypothetical protein
MRALNKEERAKASAIKYEVRVEAAFEMNVIPLSSASLHN